MLFCILKRFLGLLRHGVTHVVFVNFWYHKIKLSFEKCFSVSASIQEINAVSVQNKRLGFRTSGLREARIKLKEGSKPLDPGSTAGSTAAVAVFFPPLYKNRFS